MKRLFERCTDPIAREERLTSCGDSTLSFFPNPKKLLRFSDFELTEAPVSELLTRSTGDPESYAGPAMVPLEGYAAMECRYCDRGKVEATGAGRSRGDTEGLFDFRDLNIDPYTILMECVRPKDAVRTVGKGTFERCRWRGRVQAVCDLQGRFQYLYSGVLGLLRAPHQQVIV